MWFGYVFSHTAEKMFTHKTDIWRMGELFMSEYLRHTYQIEKHDFEIRLIKNHKRNHKKDPKAFKIIYVMT